MGRFACFLILAAVAASACGDHPGHLTTSEAADDSDSGPDAARICVAGQPPVTATNTCGLPTGCSVRAWLDETGCALRYDKTCPCRLNPDAHCADPGVAMIRYVIPLTWSGSVATGIEHPIDLVYPTNPPDPTDQCVYTVTLQ